MDVVGSDADVNRMMEVVHGYMRDVRGGGGAGWWMGLGQKLQAAGFTGLPIVDQMANGNLAASEAEDAALITSASEGIKRSAGAGAFRSVNEFLKMLSAHPNIAWDPQAIVDTYNSQLPAMRLDLGKLHFYEGLAPGGIVQPQDAMTAERRWRETPGMMKYAPLADFSLEGVPGAKIKRPEGVPETTKKRIFLTPSGRVEEQPYQ